MSTDKLVAVARTEFGKGAARRLRAAKLIPAVVYGHGSEATHIALPAHETTMALRHHGKSAVLELQIDGKAQLAMTKQIQVDDLHRVIEHIDFVAVKAGEKIEATVAVHIVGDAQRNTVVVTEHSEVVVKAESTHVPEVVEVSIDGLQAGDLIHASDLAFPSGVELITPADTVIVHVTEAQLADTGEAPAEAAAE